MKTQIVSRSSQDCRRLILIFAGWGMDFRPFASLHRDGYDIAVVWDYRDFDEDLAFVDHYDETCLIAWSFGVAAACHSDVLKNKNISARIAVCGTPRPVDAHTGIAPDIFKATLDNLSEENLHRFYRRMCGGSSGFAAFEKSVPHRSVDELRDELEVFDNMPLPDNMLSWDLAVIGSRDAIISPSAQLAAWHDTPVIIEDWPHLPDFQTLIDRYIIDKERVSQRFSANAASYEDNAIIQNILADDLIQKLDKAKAFDNCRLCIEAGCGTGLLSRQLDKALPADSRLEMWDIFGANPLSGPLRHFKIADAEIAITKLPEASVDIIASASALQWFNSPAEFLRQCARVCRHGAFVGITTYIKGNLDKIAGITGRRLPLLSEDQWRKIIPAEFETITLETGTYHLYFDTAIEAFRHLRDTGVNSLGRTSDGERGIIAAVRRLSPEADGRFCLNYRSIIFILRRK